MAYDSTNRVIRTPISIADVQAALGTSSGDLATLCLMNNINMWSARKPVYMNKVSVLTDAEWKTGRSISGYLVSFGIKKRASAAKGDYVDSNGDVKSAVWEYDRPVRDNTNVFRLSDFTNYYVNASNPMTITLPTTNVIYMASGQDGTSLSFTIHFDISKYKNSSNEDSGNIKCSDLFGDILGYYPSVLMTTPAGQQFVISSDKTIGAITDTSEVTGITISFKSRLIYEAMAHDDTTHPEPSGTINQTKWTACVVLLSRRLQGTTTLADHALWGSGISTTTTVVRLEHTAAVNNVWVDRKILTVRPLKYSYISSMKARFTLESINSWWTITSITFIANVEQSDANLTFTASASATTYGQIYVGTNYVANQYPNTSNLTVNSYSTANLDFSNTTGTGVQRSLTYLATKYSPVGSPSAPYKPLISLVVTLHNTYGDWKATLTIQDDLSPRTVEVNCT